MGVLVRGIISLLFCRLARVCDVSRNVHIRTYLVHSSVTVRLYTFVQERGGTGGRGREGKGGIEVVIYCLIVLSVHHSSVEVYVYKAES